MRIARRESLKSRILVTPRVYQGRPYLELWQKAVFDTGDEGAGGVAARLKSVAMACDEGIDAVAQAARDFQQEPGQGFVAGKLASDFQDCCRMGEDAFRCEQEDC